MKIELFVSHGFAPCGEAARVWSIVAREAGASWRVVDINSDDGAAYASALGVHAVPMVVVDGAPLVLGAQSLEEARHLLASLQADPASNVYAATATEWAPVSK